MLQSFREVAPTLAKNGHLSILIDHQTIGSASQETSVNALGIMIGRGRSFFICTLDYLSQSCLISNQVQLWPDNCPLFIIVVVVCFKNMTCLKDL